MVIFSLLMGCSETEAETPQQTPANIVNTRSYAECFPHIIEGFGNPYTDIESYVLNETCAGTHTQSFRDIEHVVFLGDSITVGTYPTPNDEFYRSLLAKKLAAHYDLIPPQESWYQVNYDTGQVESIRSGDFSSCAALGARTRELFSRSSQLEGCFTEDLYDKKILVIMTMGGNDLNVITQDVVRGKPPEDLWQTAEKAVAKVDEGMEWLRDPKFSKGVDVVFTNVYEFTDGTGDATTCPFSSMVNLNIDVDAPILEELIMWMEGQYFETAKRYGFDMLFLAEKFCGHGFHNEDPSTRCYLGPNTERWFDDTCLHPNPVGHAKISELFFSIIAAE